MQEVDNVKLLREQQVASKNVAREVLQPPYE
jgi:hypothetical protein